MNPRIAVGLLALGLLEGAGAPVSGFCALAAMLSLVLGGLAAMVAADVARPFFRTFVSALALAIFLPALGKLLTSQAALCLLMIGVVAVLAWSAARAWSLPQGKRATQNRQRPAALKPVRTVTERLLPPSDPLPEARGRDDFNLLGRRRKDGPRSRR